MASDDMILAKLAELNRGQQTMITGIQALTEAVDLQTKQLTAVNEWLREPAEASDMPEQIKQISHNVAQIMIAVAHVLERLDRVR